MCNQQIPVPASVSVCFVVSIYSEAFISYIVTRLCLSMSTTAQTSSSFEAKGRKESTLDKGKQSQTTEQLNERQSSPDSKTMSQGEETEATKAQNSMKARKRTKTGCLSMSSQSRATLELSRLTLSSVSEKAHQVWRGTANLC